MPTVYHRDQPGAPEPVYSSPQAGPGGFLGMKVFLKACLVTGYGTYPAAGWELVDEGSLYLILRNGTHSGYVCFSFLENYTTCVYLAETYTGVVDNVITGDGVKSGTSTASLAQQRFNTTWAVYSSSHSSWFMVADESTFILGMAGHSNSGSIQNNSNYSFPWRTLYVGEDTNGNFISVGGTRSSGDNLNNILNAFSSSGFTALRNPDTGFLVGDDSISPQLGGLDGGTGYSWKNSVAEFPVEDVPLIKTSWGLNNSPLAGDLKGIALPGGLMNISQYRVCRILGNPEGMGLRNINTPVDLGDSHTYFVAPTHAVTPTFLITDNPEFW